MKQQPSSLALLRDANPVSVDPTAVRSSRAKAVFEQIISEPRNPRERLRWRDAARRLAGGRRLRARLAVGGAGISAVIAAVVVVAISGSAVGTAFAGWSARPTSALPGQTTDLARRCGLSAPVLVEARGPYTAAVFASRSGGTACIEGPSVSFAGSIGGVHAPDNPIAPNQIQTAVATGSDGEGHAFVLLAGRVGSAVRSIVIHRSNHIDVTASIKGGWYLAWWPDLAHATNATVTTSSAAHNIALPTLATSAPGCTAPPGGACVGLQAGSNGSAGVPGPPLISGPIAKPFAGTLLLNVDNASTVLVCFHPPRNAAAAMQPNAPTGLCTHATLLTRLPASYPVQQNLLELFPKSVWSVKLPAASRQPGAVFLVVAFDARGKGQIRNEITNW